MQENLMCAEHTNQKSKQNQTNRGERSGGLPQLPPRSSAPVEHHPDPEVRADRPRRRKFSADYKRRILAAVDACSENGQIGQILRREGLYSSHIQMWREQFNHGGLAALAPKKRGRKPKPIEPQPDKVATLQRRVRMLEDQLHRARLIIDVQKKNSMLLGFPTDTQNEDENNS
jgi:transposase-like protein